MQPLRATIDTLLWESEGTALDFKEAQYRFAGAADDEKSEIVKDIMALANAFRRDDAFILLGVREVNGGRAEVVGVEQHLPDASLQQLVNSKTNRPVEFSYHALEVDGKQIGVIRVPQQRRPVFLMKPYGRLDALVVYLRRGSSTAKATPDEIAQMGAVTQQSAHIDPERRALELLLQHARFAESVWQLINDISQIPEHFITNTARSPAYDAAKRARWSAFNSEYTAFKRDVAAVIDLLRSIRTERNRSSIEAELVAAQDLRSSIESFVSTAHEVHALHHSDARQNAMAVADRVGNLVAERMVELSHG